MVLGASGPSEFGQDLQAISAGGGLSFLINRVKRRLIPNIIMVCGMPRVSKSPRHLGHPEKLEIEPGRFLVAQAGVLITQVRERQTNG